MKGLASLFLALLGVALCEAVCRDLRTDCRYQTRHCNNWWGKMYCASTCRHCGNPPPPTREPPPTKVPPPPSGKCGVTSFAGSRVIAGTTARPGSWPWQVLMKSNGRAGCGASWIGGYWVVTAAHCVARNKNPSSYELIMGAHDKNNDYESNRQKFRVTRVISHPSYNRRPLDCDIALFKLATLPRITKYVAPVCLGSGAPSPGEMCYITGWGKTRHPGSMTQYLQQARLPVVSKQRCHDLNSRNRLPPVTDNMICAGSGGTDRKSGCHGDSGGPFVCNKGGRWELHGAVSHGSPTCSSTNSFTVFARVQKFVSWIEQEKRRN